MPNTTVPHISHKIFHWNGQPCAAMTLQDRHIDKNIWTKYEFVFFCFCETFSIWYWDFLIIAFGMSRCNFPAGFFDCRFDPAVFVTPLPIIACMIKHIHFARTCIAALTNNFRYQFWICISRTFRADIPSDIRFDDNLLPFLHKGLNPA